MAGKSLPGPVLAAASAAWAKTLHPRPISQDACAWMAAVFAGGRHLCRAEVCPRQCPRSPDHGTPAPLPWWNAPIPEMTAEEIAAAERFLAPLRALRIAKVPRIEVAVDVAPAEVAEEPMSDEEEAIWAEQVESWFAPTTPPPLPSVPVLSPPGVAREDNPRTSAPYPPCKSCGKIRTIMMVMKASSLAPAATLCSPCWRGEAIV